MCQMRPQTYPTHRFRATHWVQFHVLSLGLHVWSIPMCWIWLQTTPKCWPNSVHRIMLSSQGRPKKLPAVRQGHGRGNSYCYFSPATKFPDAWSAPQLSTAVSPLNTTGRTCSYYISLHIAHSPIPPHWFSEEGCGLYAKNTNILPFIGLIKWIRASAIQPFACSNK